MSERKLPTFWRSCLAQDGAYLALLLLLFAGSGLLATRELRQRYIARHQAEAKTIETTLSEQLSNARTRLTSFSKLPKTQQNSASATLLNDFSDLYLLDNKGRISSLLKQNGSSQVFPGFSLSRSPIASYVEDRQGRPDYSALVRGFEDSRASIYIAVPADSGLLLGRLNLDSLEQLLAQISKGTNTPILVVVKDGSVLLSSNPELRLSDFPIHASWNRQTVQPQLEIDRQHWIPIITPASSVCAAIVTLTPTQHLVIEQRAIVTLLVAVSLGSGAMVILKGLRTRQLFCDPIAQLAESMQDLEKGKTPETQSRLATPSFAELATIQASYQTMAKAVREREQQLRYHACIDELTGLLNRRELLEQLETLLDAQTRRQGDQGVAALFCDLDFFKEINDTLGHAAGDTVLRTVADRIRRHLRASDLAGRMGGDEIVVVLEGIGHLDTAVTIAERIGGAIAQPMQEEGLDISISASIGVALAQPEECVDELMARADTAMYEAKQAGRGRVVRIEA